MCAGLSAHEGKNPPAFDAEIFREACHGPAAVLAGHIAEIDGEAVGYVLHCPDYDTDRMCRGVTVVDLYVEKAARGRGLGRALMAAAARAGSAAGARMMAWTVEADNELARGFYRSVGCEADAILMCGAGDDRLRELAAAATPAGLRLRAPLPGDAPAVARMIEALLIDMGEVPPADIGGRLMADGFGPAPAFVATVAETGGTLAGYAVHWFLYDTEAARPELLLSDIYVMPERRGDGVGKALMAAAARRTLEGGARFMAWQVLKTNVQARAFYGRFAEEWPGVVYCHASDDEFAALAGRGGPLLATEPT